MDEPSIPPLKNYRENGFVLARGIFDPGDFHALEERCLNLIRSEFGEVFASIHDSTFLEFLSKNRQAETFLYQEIRNHPELLDVARLPAIVAEIAKLHDSALGMVLEKIPFRIDLPLVIRELAVWHQDNFYVKGSPDTITAWIPLQDVRYENGCLLVMPGSHASGPIPHDKPLLGKKFYPSKIFNREVRYVEMNRGDVLFFHGCLLHSSGFNLGSTIRFSIQARYLKSSEESDPGMGNRIPLS